MDVSQLVQYVAQACTAAARLGVGKTVWSTSTALAALSASFIAHEKRDEELDGLMLEEIRELRRNINGKGKADHSS